MDLAHVHLLINHLGIFGTILGFIVLAHGIFLKSNSAKIAAYNVFIISAIGAVVAYNTGEAAEETVEHLSGINEAMIEEHEEAALFAYISMIVLGVISILGLFVTIKKNSLLKTVAVIILIISLFSFVVIARTGLIGGKIRHTEISGNAANSNESSTGGIEEDLE